MGWTGPVDVKGDTVGIIFAPKTAARIQDLGAFWTARELQTDILPASAVISTEGDYYQAVRENSAVRFSFEGNAYDAVNLERFHEKCACACCRLLNGAPSISYGAAHHSDLVPLARFDLHRKVFIEILNADLLEEWSGEKIKDMMPPKIKTPCKDHEELKPIFSLPMAPISLDPGDIHIWKLLDGSILVHRKEEGATLYNREDPELWDITDSLGLDAETYRRMYGVPSSVR